MSSVDSPSGRSGSSTRPPVPPGSSPLPHNGVSAEARVRWITDALHRLTGRPAAAVRLRGGVVRVTVRIEAPGASGELTLAVIRVLARGDRFGHTSKAGWERLWAEVDQAPESKAPLL
ncbi:hypothetical protein KSE_39970 [Kitasatospora setae KM-6054]|uniref:Uncharacterized protein n=1 Tax=Kitasatospora setae (strain ATCC 33774 / DSM 43861 / JCM 3304 / KCC A-0304 / NBRC 14216 / KM-6054) TaxID=452652 RepID=E4NEK5_KITSK|nr:hypothetical protein KSE_39970 [Kitasatospora setae KM-6054]